MPYGYGLSYRYVGSFKNEESGGDFYNVFEILDIYQRVKKKKLLRYKNDFEEGARLYSDGDFENAKNVFYKVLKNYNEDEVAHVYYNACNEKIKLKE